MMKKLILTMIAVAALASCSNDDDNPTPVAAAPTPVPLATKITSTGAETFNNKVFDISYDSKHRINKITRTGFDPNTYNITYNTDNSLSTVSYGTTTYTFYYDATGHLTGYGDGTITTPVTFNSATGVYATSTFDFSFSDNGDISYVNNINFLHDPTLKGPFTNAGGPSGLLTLFLDPTFGYVDSRTPVSKITNTSDNTDFATYLYAYNDNGYIKNIVYTEVGGQSFSMAVEYTNF